MNSRDDDRSGAPGRAVRPADEPGGPPVHQVLQDGLNGNFDIYNALNANPEQVIVNTYGPNWQQPAAILPGRLFKFSGQLNF